MLEIRNWSLEIFVKSLLRLFIINLFALYLTSRLVIGFSYTGSWQTLAFGSLIFTAINFFIKPLFKLLFLPFNLFTFGSFSFLINSLMLYLLTHLVSQFSITAWLFTGYNYQGFVIPQIQFNYISTLILSSYLISVMATLLNWLSK